MAIAVLWSEKSYQGDGCIGRLLQNKKNKATMDFRLPSEMSIFF